jgi:hypothetical protein
MVRQRSTEKVALTATISYLSFPTAFFGVAMYSEAPFLLFVALSFWFLERDRLLPGAAFAGLAAGTRLVGIAAFLPLAVYVLRKMPKQPSTLLSYMLAAVICLAPLGVYCVYLWLDFGNPFYFAEVVNRTWARAPGDPLSTLIQYVNHPPNSTLHLVLELTASIGFLGILFVGIRRIPLSWWLYSLGVVLIPMSSGLLVSMPRYVLACLGGFVIAGDFLSERVRLKWGVWAVSFALQALLAIRFINGYWAA